MSLQNSGVYPAATEAEVMLVLVGNDLVRVLLVRVLLGSGVSRIRLAGLTELLDVPADSLIAAAALQRFNTFSNSEADALDEAHVVVLHGLQLVSQETHVVIAELLVHALVVMIVDELLQPANTYSKLHLLHTESLKSFM